MMNYEMFKEVVRDNFLNYMPDDFANYTVKIAPVHKVNKMLDGLNLLPPDKRDKIIAPTIYINDMYEKYKKSGDLEETLNLSAFELAGAYRAGMQMGENLNFSDAKEKVVMVLVNTEQNREMLKDMPHREFQDLSIMYRYVVEMNPDGIASIPIHNQLAEKMGMNEEQLYRAAAENTRRLLPPKVLTMNEVMYEIFIEDGMPEEIANIMRQDVPEEMPMYVISNDRRINGAVSMLYESELHKLAEQLGDDLYILPSSIHEVMAIPADKGDPEYLAEMVSQINMDQVALDERLSNQVYHYDKDLRKLILATDTPNKRLDGIVAEPGLVYDTKQSR